MDPMSGDAMAETPATPGAIDDTGLKTEEDLELLDRVDVDTLKSKYNPEYNLRKKTIVNRIKTEKRKSLPKQPKPKSAPAPLSKYRRRAANKRERTRMEDINNGFELLKSVLPNIEESASNKMTKITTLRLAMNYISALRDMLGQDTEDNRSDLSSDFSSDLNSDGDSASLSCVSSTEDPCLSPGSMDGNFLSMDFLSDVKLDDFDTENLSDDLLLDCT